MAVDALAERGLACLRAARSQSCHARRTSSTRSASSLEVLDQVGPDDWLRRSPANEGWTVRDLLTHLTTSESGFVPTLRRMAAGEGGVPADFDPNRWNAGQLRRRAEHAPEQLRAELERSHTPKC